MTLKQALRMVIGTVVIASLVSLVSARAQTVASQLEERDIPVTEFSALDVNGDFEVTVAKSDEYGVRVTVDQVLSPYIQVYVRAKVLYITYDSKSVPKDIRKLYKGRNAPQPVFRAVVFVPELNGVTLADNATVSGTEEFPADRFELNLTDRAQVKGLTINANAAVLKIKKNAQAVLNMTVANTIELETDNNANVRLNTNCKDLVINSSSSSVLTVSGQAETANVAMGGSTQLNMSYNCPTVAVNAEGSSKLVLVGQGQRISLRGTRNGNIDASGFPVSDVNVEFTGSATASVNTAEGALIEASLVGGSSLFFTGEPAFRITKVVKSTLAPVGTPTR